MMATQPKRKPSAKQRLAVEKIVENHGNISKAMLEAGYTAASAKNPSNLTSSKGFIQLINDAGATDQRLSEVLTEGLAATKAVVMGMKSDESFVDIQPDYAIRHKYLETAVKLKGHLKDADTPAGNTYNTYIQQNNINPNAPEAKELVDSTLDYLMEKMKRGPGTTTS